MTKGIIIVICLAAALLAYKFVYAVDKSPLITASIQKNMTPDDALRRLIAGNKRFVNREPMQTDFIKKAKLTAEGQYPAAIVLSCIDSRVPIEIVFDQNIGNAFVTRTAANVINDDILGGLEFATQVAGAKLIVVMGHDACGAVRGACANVKLGHLTQLLAKIQPAVNEAKNKFGKEACESETFINAVATYNVHNVVQMIKEKSPIIAQLLKEQKIKIVGAMYHLSTGKVEFLN